MPLWPKNYHDGLSRRKCGMRGWDSGVRGLKKERLCQRRLTARNNALFKAALSVAQGVADENMNLCDRLGKKNKIIG